MTEPDNTPTPSNRRFYLLIGAFLLAAVLMGLVSARRGKSTVERWKDEMRAKGEKFTVAELLPTRTGPPTNRLSELVRLGHVLGSPNSGISSLDHFRCLSNGVAEATWMYPKLALSTAAPGATRHTIPSSYVPYEWEDLAAEMATMETALAEVRSFLAVPDRDTGWNYQFRSPMPKCFVEKRSMAQWLGAANVLALHERRPAQALENLLSLGNLVAWHDEDFSIVGQMIRVAIGGQALRSTWATMQAPGLTEVQLAALQVQSQRLLIMPALARAMEFERAGIGQLIMEVRTGRESVASAFGTGSGSGVNLADRFAGVAWRALGAEADELFYLRFMQGQIDALRKLARLRSWAATQPDMATHSAQLATLDTWQGKMMLVSRTGLPNFNRAFQTALRYETRRELTIAALAVERHRLRHGRPPSTLNDLVPAFLPAVPVDWMDGKPLRYRLNADGTFTLWSVGEDLKDDGGDGSEVVHPTRATDIWDRRDAVWPRRAP